MSLALLGTALHLGAGCAATPTEAPVSATLYENSQLARQALIKSLNAHGVTSAHRGKVLRLDYEGQHRLEAHLSFPGDERIYEASGRYYLGMTPEFMEHSGELRRGDSHYSSMTRLTSAGAFFVDYGEEAEEEISEAARLEMIYALSTLSPTSLLSYALEFPESLGIQGGRFEEGEPCHILTFTNGSGERVGLYIDDATQLLRKVETLLYDPQLGDVTERILFEDYQIIDGVQLPGRRLERIRTPERGTGWTIDLTYQDHAWLDVDDLGAEPPPEQAQWVLDALPALPGPSEEGSAEDSGEGIVVERLALGEGLWVLSLPKQDIKTMVADLGDGLIAFEAPLSGEVGAAIIDTMSELAPTKAFHYLAMSHYHNYYTGGLRPFVHGGASLVTTDGNVEFLRDLATRPHTFHPDAQELEPNAPTFLVVEDVLSLSEGLNEVQIFDLGEESHHTDEYLVFFFPSQGILFVGDLTVVPKAGRTRPPNSRELGLKAFVERVGLEVETLVVSWRLEDQEVAIPYEDFLAIFPE